MNLSPLLDASLAIRLHVAAVLPAAIIGAWLLLAGKGTPLHRFLGRLWLALMALSAISSFFIHELKFFMGFSPIHLLSVYVLYGCVMTYRNARSGHIRAHRTNVLGLYFGGIVGAGIFTVLPGRIMNRVLFEPSASAVETGSLLLFLVIMAGIAIALTFAGRLLLPRRP